VFLLSVDTKYIIISRNSLGWLIGILRTRIKWSAALSKACNNSSWRFMNYDNYCTAEPYECKFLALLSDSVNIFVNISSNFKIRAALKISRRNESRSTCTDFPPIIDSRFYNITDIVNDQTVLPFAIYEIRTSATNVLRTTLVFKYSRKVMDETRKQR